MPRNYPSSMTASFGPGPLTPAVKWLLIANVAVFVVMLFAPAVIAPLALQPVAVVEHFRWWQLATYMFVHAGLFHLVFNMLALWMFGVELERLWGTRFFSKYYALTGIGAGVCTVVISLLPLGRLSAGMYMAATVGASGAIFGLLLAYALYFPHREIYMYFLFRVPVRVFVIIVGAISLLAATSNSMGGTAHIAHLGGLLVGWVYLKSGNASVHPIAEIKYRYLKWKINRVRKKFDVYSGGRADDVNRRIH